MGTVGDAHLPLTVTNTRCVYKSHTDTHVNE